MNIPNLSCRLVVVGLITATTKLKLLLEHTALLNDDETVYGEAKTF
jgi:hypothetical protein